MIVDLLEDTAEGTALSPVGPACGETPAKRRRLSEEVSDDHEAAGHFVSRDNRHFQFNGTLNSDSASGPPWLKPLSGVSSSEPDRNVMASQWWSHEDMDNEVERNRTRSAKRRISRCTLTSIETLIQSANQDKLAQAGRKEAKVVPR